VSIIINHQQPFDDRCLKNDEAGKEESFAKAINRIRAIVIVDRSSSSTSHLMISA
jgi:hypothetical protein